MLATSPVRFEPALSPISVEGKWGFIDVAGRIIIEPTFVSAKLFSEGLAVVGIAGTSQEDLALERTHQGFIGPNGAFFIPPEPPRGVREIEGYHSYSYSDFHEGLARIHVNDASGMDGYIDRKGQLVIEPKYESAGDFSEGLAYARTWMPWDQPGPRRSGFIDQRGQFVIETDALVFAHRFSEGRASVAVASEGRPEAYGLINNRGEYVISPGAYDYLSDPVGGAIRVVKDEEVGLVNRDGAIVVPLGRYDQIVEPSDGRIFAAESKGKVVLIDATGHRLADVKEPGDVGSFHGGMATIEQHGRMGYIDETGGVRIALQFDSAEPFKHGLALVKLGDTCGYINTEGRFVWKTDRWDEPLRYSVSEPLSAFLPDSAVQALPLSYNWQRVKNAIVFVADRDLEALRVWYRRKCSKEFGLTDLTDYDAEPGKIALMIEGPRESHLELFAMDGNAEEVDGFVEFYGCKNMEVLRNMHPTKVIGILIEN